MPLLYDGEVKIHKVSHMSPMDNNGYIVTCPTTGESIIIDTPGESEKLLSEIGDLNIKAVLITHGHGDHIADFRKVKNALQKDMGIHEKDSGNLSPAKPDFFLKDGDEITIGTVRLELIHTPGHTPGSTCILTGNHLFSGDTLFPGGPGATRSAEGFKQIVSSITSKLLTLPDDTNVYPGHGDDTTIGNAREEYTVFSNNPHPDDLYGTVGWLTG